MSSSVSPRPTRSSLALLTMGTSVLTSRVYTLEIQ